MFFYFDFNSTKSNNIVVCFDLIKHSNFANFFWILYYCLHKHQLFTFECFFELIMFFVYRFARVFMWFLFIFSFVVFNMTLSSSFNSSVVSVDISFALIKKNDIIIWYYNRKTKNWKKKISIDKKKWIMNDKTTLCWKHWKMNDDVCYKTINTKKINIEIISLKLREFSSMNFDYFVVVVRWT